MRLGMIEQLKNLFEGIHIDSTGSYRGAQKSYPQKKFFEEKRQKTLKKRQKIKLSWIL